MTTQINYYEYLEKFWLELAEFSSTKAEYIECLKIAGRYSAILYSKNGLEFMATTE